MKTTRRLFAILLALALLASCAPAAFALDIPGHAKDSTEKEKITLADDSLTSLLKEYTGIVEEVREECEKTWYADACFGVLSDLDKDGYPELMLMYSPDGTDLEALVACRTKEDKAESMKLYVCTMAGGAAGNLAAGSVGKEKVIHVIYKNSAGPTRRMGWDAVVSFTGGKLGVKHTLEWLEDATANVNQYAVDGVTDSSKYRDIYDGISRRYVSPESDGAAALDELLREIADYAPSSGKGK